MVISPFIVAVGLAALHNTGAHSAVVTAHGELANDEALSVRSQEGTEEEAPWSVGGDNGKKLLEAAKGSVKGWIAMCQKFTSSRSGASAKTTLKAGFDSLKGAITSSVAATVKNAFDELSKDAALAQEVDTVIEASAIQAVDSAPIVETASSAAIQVKNTWLEQMQANKFKELNEWVQTVANAQNEQLQLVHNSVAPAVDAALQAAVGATGGQPQVMATAIETMKQKVVAAVNGGVQFTSISSEGLQKQVKAEIQSKLKPVVEGAVVPARAATSNSAKTKARTAWNSAYYAVMQPKVVAKLNQLLAPQGSVWNAFNAAVQSAVTSVGFVSSSPNVGVFRDAVLTALVSEAKFSDDLGKFIHVYAQTTGTLMEQKFDFTPSAELVAEVLKAAVTNSDPEPGKRMAKEATTTAIQTAVTKEMLTNAMTTANAQFRYQDYTRGMEPLFAKGSELHTQAWAAGIAEMFGVGANPNLTKFKTLMAEVCQALTSKAQHTVCIMPEVQEQMFTMITSQLSGGGTEAFVAVWKTEADIHT